MKKSTISPPLSGDCLPTVWPAIGTLLLTAVTALVLIRWGIVPTVAVTTTSGIGIAATAIARRANLRSQWPALGVLAGVAVVALVLINWGMAPSAAVTTTTGIGITGAVTARMLLGRAVKTAQWATT